MRSAPVLRRRAAHRALSRFVVFPFACCLFLLAVLAICSALSLLSEFISIVGGGDRHVLAPGGDDARPPAACGVPGWRGGRPAGRCAPAKAKATTPSTMRRRLLLSALPAARDKTPRVGRRAGVASGLSSRCS